MKTLNIQIRSTGSEPTEVVKLTAEKLQRIFGQYAEEVMDGWEVRHPLRPWLKYSAV